MEQNLSLRDRGRGSPHIRTVTSHFFLTNLIATIKEKQIWEKMPWCLHLKHNSDNCCLFAFASSTSVTQFLNSDNICHVLYHRDTVRLNKLEWSKCNEKVMTIKNYHYTILCGSVFQLILRITNEWNER